MKSLLLLIFLVTFPARAETDPARSCALITEHNDALLVGLSLDLENALPSLKDLTHRRLRYLALEKIEPDAAIRSLATEIMNGDTAHRAQLTAAYKKYIGREPQPQELRFLLDRLADREPWYQVYASVFSHPEYMKGAQDDAEKVLADIASESPTTQWRTRVLGLDRTSMAILFWKEHHTASTKRLKERFQRFLGRQPSEKELVAARKIEDWQELDANIIGLPEYREHQTSRFAFCRISGKSPN